jgi:antitoxin ParD1/3/4
LNFSSICDNNENKAMALRNAIQKGLESPSVENFNFDENLFQLNAGKRKNG